jgi:hypothetical protein
MEEDGQDQRSQDTQTQGDEENLMITREFFDSTAGTGFRQEQVA